MKRLLLFLFIALFLGLCAYGYLHRAEWLHLSSGTARDPEASWFSKQSRALRRAFDENPQVKAFWKSIDAFRAHQERLIEEGVGERSPTPPAPSGGTPRADEHPSEK
jgi:hypothetical protein